MKAKDKGFNATLKTDFDASIGRINVVPQDVGRVLLNLFNNAFYAVMEKKKHVSDGYEPTMSPPFVYPQESLTTKLKFTCMTMVLAFLQK